VVCTGSNQEVTHEESTGHRYRGVRQRVARGLPAAAGSIMWDFSLQVDRESDRTLFMQVATSIINDINRGRLRSGERLPGTRTLAASRSFDRLSTDSARHCAKPESQGL
jgi:hypothetical protein